MTQRAGEPGRVGSAVRTSFYVVQEAPVLRYQDRVLVVLADPATFSHKLTCFHKGALMGYCASDRV